MRFDQRYVFFSGLPPSPPSAPEGVGDGAFGNSRNARAIKPLGVDVRRPKRKVNGSLIAIAVLSTVIALIICTLAAWLLILRFRGSDDMAQRFPHSALLKFSRSSGMCCHPANFVINAPYCDIICISCSVDCKSTVAHFQSSDAKCQFKFTVNYRQTFSGNILLDYIPKCCHIG